MRKTVKRLAAFTAMCLLASSFSGCGKKASNQADFDESMLYDMSTYSYSEEMPDWKGDKVSIVKWTDAASPNSTASKTTIIKDNPVLNEIERVTGVSYDIENCFDNAGNSFDATISKIIASKTFPDIGEGIPNIAGLIEEEMLWDISEYVKEYCPTVYKLFGPESNTEYGKLWKNQIEKYGGVYELAFGRGGLREMTTLDGSYPELTEDQVNFVEGNGYSMYPSFYVRDDLLKQIYPEAHSVEELKKIFKERGEFTEAEIFDVPIESPQDFIDFLYKLRELKKNDALFFPMFTHMGSDNWPVLVQLGSMFGYSTYPYTANVNYFSYYDMKENKVKATFKQPWFKDILKMYNGFIRDGIASDEALIDTNSQFCEKITNGYYGITYGNGSGAVPQENEINGDFRYRKVFAKYKINTDNYLFTQSDYTSWNRFTFFKPAMNEKKLIQVLRMFEFLATDAGQKLMYWGPKSLGLYTEDADGKLQYTNEELKNQMLYPGQYGTELANKYGLGDYWPLPVKVRASNHDPKLFYIENSDYEKKFDAALIERHIPIKAKDPLVYSTDSLNKFEEAEAFWTARQGFEDAMLKIFAAEDDKEFEKLYKKMVEYAEAYGLDDAFYEKYTEYYKEELNKDYMQNIYDAQKNK